VSYGVNHEEHRYLISMVFNSVTANALSDYSTSTRTELGAQMWPHLIQ
jgi:hypothetical protein